jgi:acyl-coenzyme A thioesterase PaaI-like protein
MLLEATLEQYLHEHIPLSKAMGLRVEVASQERVLLGCPLEPNLNHRGTGFGGSIASIATLAAKLVVRKSTIDYIASVDSDFTAELRPPSHEAISHFWETFERRGSARIELKVEVLCRGEEAAHFDGTFVAIRS